MRKILAATFVSLDGIMQAPGGPEEDEDGRFESGGWTFYYFDETLGALMDEVFDRSFDLLLGRRTYDIFAAHWPRVEASDPMGALFGNVTKYVATHRPESLAWKNSQSLGSDVVASLRTIKAGEGPDLLIQGSSDLIRQLTAAGLIDEYRLLIFPVVLGKGKRLFGDSTAPQGLRLTRSQLFPTGVIEAVYEPAGPLKTGSFALDP